MFMGNYLFFLPFGFTAFILFGGRPDVFAISKALIHSLLAIVPCIFLYIFLDLKVYDGSPVSIMSFLYNSFLLLFLYALALIILSKDVRDSGRSVIGLNP